MLHPDEVAADKTLALFGRAAARDLVDVAALSERYTLQQLCELDAEKDAGFDRRVLADALAAAAAHPDAAFAELGLEPETGRFGPFDALLAGPTVRPWRSRTRRPCGKSAVDSDVVDTIGSHPVDARSRVRFELGLCGGGRALDHSPAGCTSGQQAALNGVCGCRRP